MTPTVFEAISERALVNYDREKPFREPHHADHYPVFPAFAFGVVNVGPGGAEFPGTEKYWNFHGSGAFCCCCCCGGGGVGVGADVGAVACIFGEGPATPPAADTTGVLCVFISSLIGGVPDGNPTGAAP